MSKLGEGRRETLDGGQSPGQPGAPAKGCVPRADRVRPMPTEDARGASEEIFGPRRFLIPVDGLEQGIEVANGVPYGPFRFDLHAKC